MPETQVIPPMFTQKNGAERFLSLCARSNAALTYDDVLLVPQSSDISTRECVSTETQLKRHSLQTPLIAANMDTVCESEMAIEMSKWGGCGVIHRYMSQEKQLTEVKIVRDAVGPDRIVAVAVGVNHADRPHITKLVAAGANTIVVDVAHGHHRDVASLLTWIKLQEFPVEIIAGNVATQEGVKFLYDAGADTIKIGVGPGAVCTTRSVTGHGIPQLYALAIAKEFSFLTQGGRSFKIIADGGIKNSGDIVKALACGADAVMIGNLFAGTREAPGKTFFSNGGNGPGRRSKVYRGMASQEAQEQFYGNAVNAPEGIIKTIPFKGEVNQIVTSLSAGIRSGLSYSGAYTPRELYEKADWVRISDAGLRESLTL